MAFLAFVSFFCMFEAQTALANFTDPLEYRVVEFASGIKSTFLGLSSSASPLSDPTFTFFLSYDPSDQTYLLNVRNSVDLIRSGTLSNNSGHFFNTLEIELSHEMTAFSFSVQNSGPAVEVLTYPDLVPPHLFSQTLTSDPVTIIGSYERITPADGFLFRTTLTDVSSIFIPGAIWLLGSGLIGLMGFRTKSESKGFSL